MPGATKLSDHPAMRPRPKKRVLTDEELVAGVRAGDRAVLGQAVTLVESTRPGDQARARDLLDAVMPDTGQATRVGITGVPGVGKSTFIETLGTRLTAAGHRVAVLAVDPSSSRTGGSILGDKTRMGRLSTDPNAFIRPSPAAGTLGGVASRTLEALLLCEAAGHDVVLVETVGVGQSETMVAGMTDTFLALMLPGAGDELQGIKRGLLELADIIAVNKADADPAGAKRAAHEYRQALRYVHPRVEGWRVPVTQCSALNDEGVDAVWAKVEAHRDHLSGEALDTLRADQLEAWLWRLVDEGLRHALRQDSGPQTANLVAAVRAQRISPTVAAQRLLLA